MYVLYTGDSILASPNQKDIDTCIEDIKRAGLQVTVEGDLSDFLCVKITQHDDGTLELTQAHLIDQILQVLRLDHANTQDTPAYSSAILKRDTKGIQFNNSFHYASVIGKLNYLEGGSRLDISYATHQCARFMKNP